MPVPFLDLKIQYQSIKPEIDEAIAGILARTEFVTGPTVRAFEEAFAAAHGVRFCATCNSGTAALHLMLWGLDIGPGDEVLTAANTFMATAGGIKLAGARPRLADVREEDFNLDPERVEAALTPRTRALLPVHLYGQCADLAPLAEIARRHGLLLLEDAAQAHLATFEGGHAGQHGRAAAFSFYPGKNLGAYGEGGAVLTNDEDLWRRICRLRDHGMPEKYLHTEWGHNYRLEGLQGAVLGVKLRHLEAWTEARRQVAAWYREELAGLPGLLCPQELPGRRHVYHLFVIRVTPESGISRDALMARLQQAGIGCGLHYPRPVHLQPAAAELGYQAGDFPVTERLAGEILSLPMYAELTREQVAEVGRILRSALS
jgi:dTDP-4-amino-4,6-dideoxygalactose transaminase